MAKTQHAATKESQSGETGKEIRRGGGAGMLAPFEEMERRFERMLEAFAPRGFSNLWDRPAFAEMLTARPRIDIVDEDDDLVVHAEVPGVDKDDLDVSIGDSTLTIRGTAHKESKEEKGDFYRSEIARGAFSRTVTLPSQVDSEKAEATYKEGMLTLRLPKMEASKRRRISIKG